MKGHLGRFCTELFNYLTKSMKQSIAVTISCQTELNSDDNKYLKRNNIVTLFYGLIKTSLPVSKVIS